MGVHKSKGGGKGVTATLICTGAFTLVFSILQGCQSVLPTVIGPSVDYYCTLPVEARKLVRLGIDSRTLPNKVRIECYGETQE